MRATARVVLLTVTAYEAGTWQLAAAKPSLVSSPSSQVRSPRRMGQQYSSSEVALALSHSCEVTSQPAPDALAARVALARVRRDTRAAAGGTAAHGMRSVGVGERWKRYRI